MYLNWGNLHNKNITARCRKPSLKWHVHEGLRHPMGALTRGPRTCPGTETLCSLPTQSLDVGKHKLLLICNLTWALQLEGNEICYFQSLRLYPLLLQRQHPYSHAKGAPSLSSVWSAAFCSHQLSQAKKPASAGEAIRSSTNSSVAVTLGHTQLWVDPPPRNYSYRQCNIDPCFSTHHSPIPLMAERGKRGSAYETTLVCNIRQEGGKLWICTRGDLPAVSNWIAGKAESRWWAGNRPCTGNMGSTCCTTATLCGMRAHLIKTLVFCPLHHQEYGRKMGHENTFSQHHLRKTQI